MRNTTYYLVKYCNHNHNPFKVLPVEKIDFNSRNIKVLCRGNLSQMHELAIKLNALDD